MMSKETQFLLSLAQGRHIPRNTNPRIQLLRPASRPQDVSDPTILANIAVVEINMRLIIHHPDNGGPSGLQVFRMHIACDPCTDQFLCGVAKQLLASVTHEDNPVVP